MHELDLTSAVVPPLQTSFVNQYNVEKEFDDDKGELYMEFMFSGASRTAWEVHSICIDGKDCVAPGLNATDQKKTGPKLVLKTLNWNMKYDEVTYDHQRVDALAAERLTSSPHVINAYSFCGGSVINEFADGGSFGRMVRRLNGTVIPSEQLIVYARDAALGLADIHEIDGRGNVTTLTHHDYAAKNFLTVNGKLKISTSTMVNCSVGIRDSIVDVMGSSGMGSVAPLENALTEDHRKNVLATDTVDRQTKRWKSIIWDPSCFTSSLPVVGLISTRYLPRAFPISRHHQR
jgi:hypothetical protein